MSQILAITGGTGFVGKILIDRALALGHTVRALARKTQTARDGVEWVAGALDDPDALAHLVEGADAVIHVAGLTTASTRAELARANLDGTMAVISAMQRAGARRLVHVSSLTAREPQISDYGWSKAEAEIVILKSGLDWTIVRPPAVYGPGDHEQLDLFRAARWGIIPLPPSGRLSLIHVDDLARLLLALVPRETLTNQVLEPDDGQPGGWSHVDYGQMIAASVGTKALTLPMPAPMIRIGARLDGWLRRKNAKLTPDRAAYFCHADWVVSPKRRPGGEIWLPEISTPAGLAATAQWYRTHDWL